MPQEQIKFGFISPTYNPQDYYLGQGNLPRIVLQEKGNWADSLPITEQQTRGIIYIIDSINCTAFATTSQIEAYEYKAFGERNNYSDRFVALMSGTTKYGNDPSRVYEAIRKFGLVPEEMCPWSDDIESIDDYLSWKGVDKDACIAEGKKWLARKDFLHNWVFRAEQPLDEKINNMKTALRYSPLAIGVYAWEKDERGIYVRRGNDTHWTDIYAIDNVEFCFDSYDPFLKVLSADFNFYYCKRISIELKPAETKPKQTWWFVDITRQILTAMSEVLRLQLQLLKVKIGSIFK